MIKQDKELEVNMKIGLFTDTYPPQVNGVAVSTLMLREELEKLGHEVYVFTTTDPNTQNNEPNTYRLKSVPFIFFPKCRVGVPYSRKAYGTARELGLDIIHTQTEFSLGIFARLMSDNLDLPVVHTYHTMYKDYAHYITVGYSGKLTDGVAKLITKNFCDKCNAVIAPTLKTKEVLEEYEIKPPISVIPTGIKIDHFNPACYTIEQRNELRKEYGISPEAPVLAYVGRMAKEKSLDVVIRQLPELFRRLPNAKFVAVGDGPARSGLEDLVSDLGIQDKVIFTGLVPYSKIGLYYQIGDAFISASTTETQGLTYIEAMAAGLPVIAKKDESILDVVNDGVNGAIFVNDEEVPEIVARILTDNEYRKQLSENALQTAQRFSSTTFGKSVESLYYEVLKKCNRVIL